MEIFRLLSAAAAGYLIGSFSFSIFISKVFFGKDVRSSGSGNAGATNMARTYGALPGLITLLGDFLKSFAAIFLGKLLAGEEGAALGGAACVLGHCFPVYYGFHGGKAVSTGLAVLFAADWRCGAAALLVFLAVAFSSKKVSISSLSGGVAGLIVCFFFGRSFPRLLMVCFAVALGFIRHAENIRRLLRHEEPDFHFGKR